MTFELVRNCLLYFSSSMLGIMLGWKLNTAVDRAHRAYVKALKASNKSSDKLIAVLKEQISAQEDLIRVMRGTALFEKRPDPPTVN